MSESAVEPAASAPGATAWLAEDEQQAWRAFLAMRRDLDRAIEAQLGGVGLSTADFALLVPLSEAPDGRLRVRELARATGWDRSRLSHHLGRMEQRQLVTRHSCDSDGRGIWVQLSEHGRAAVRQAAPGHVSTVRRYLIDLLSEHELQTLRTISERVSSHIRADSPTDSCGQPEAPRLTARDAARDGPASPPPPRRHRPHREAADPTPAIPVQLARDALSDR